LVSPFLYAAIVRTGKIPNRKFGKYLLIAQVTGLRWPVAAKLRIKYELDMC
jgi:hypothetical protein